MTVNVIKMEQDDVIIVSVNPNIPERAKELILAEYTKYFKNVIIQSSSTTVTVVRKKDLE